MKKSLIKNYAKLIARVGGNIQKGQEVFITAETDRPDFIVLLAEECYKAGAANVFVDWKCQQFDKLAARFESVRSLSAVESWEEAKLAYQADRLPVTIKSLSADHARVKAESSTKLTHPTRTRTASTNQ